MRKLLAILLACILAAPANAAYLFVRDGGNTSSCRGTGWNAACDQPSSAEAIAQRGDVICIAKGTYNGWTNNVPVSGTTPITIRATTAADHCSDVGWSADYAGTAQINGTVFFNSNYWIFDGLTKNPDWRTGYGFKITHTGDATAIQGTASYITTQYVEVQGSGPDDAGPTNDGVYFINSSTNLTFRHMFLHDQGRAQFILRGTKNSLFEYILVARNESVPAQHSEAVSLFEGAPSGNVFRYWICEDIEGTGCIVVGGTDGGAPATDNTFCGILAYWTAAYPHPGQTGSYVSNGTVTSWTAEQASNSRYYNSTVIIPPTGGIYFTFGNFHVGPGSGNYSYNNLYVSSGAIGGRIAYGSGITHDYNGYSGSSAFGEAHGQTGVAMSVFQNTAAYDFRLAVPTTPGTPLADPCNMDMLGNTRGIDGWDKGAFEFGTAAGDTTAPVVSQFAIPTTATSLTVSVTVFTATDAVGVTGYILTESSVAPLPASAGWTATAPTTYTFGTDGPKTLYAWAKDAAGNVSAAVSDTVTISIPSTAGIIRGLEVCQGCEAKF